MPQPFQPLLIICSFPDQQSANTIAKSLIDQQLAACVTLQPPALSIYRWQGEIQESAEVIAHIKTSATCYPALEQELLRQHPYEVPEIIALTIGPLSPSYQQWMQEQLLPQ